ncbi:RO60-like protein [Mya arenaria]|uniref:RO60-like protein n=1 Tax=Mya arenaria TaxID=6604 RepID=A0ABY7DKG1_MYAAR|nr:RO60-like protein [Mya arenaria]
MRQEGMYSSWMIWRDASAFSSWDQREGPTILISSGRGVEVVDKIRDISVNRRNVKQNALLYAYAICARSNNKDVKKRAYQYLSDICRIPTHLFMFIKFCEQESNTGEMPATGTGWGRAHKRAISRWYLNFANNPQLLARYVTKFKSREGWTHRDVLRLAHAHTREPVMGFILRYIVKGQKKAREMYMCEAARQTQELAAQQALDAVGTLLGGIEHSMQTTDAQELCELIDTHKLTWEQCPSQLLKDKGVWRKLIPHMPIEALVRNLGRMTQIELFEGEEGRETLAEVVRKIKAINQDPVIVEEEEEEEVMETDQGAPQVSSTLNKRNFLHPFKILLALETYRNCNTEHKKGKSTWTANKDIVEALDQAFYQAFSHVEPTRKTFYLGVDVSGSMSQPVLGSSNRMEELGITADMKMEDILNRMNQMRFGQTDCAMPMKDAIEMKRKDIDVFIVYTDCETWAGNIHPCIALNEYRKYAGKPDAKLIVCGMTATEFTIADKDDKNMLDISGFDSNAPRLIADFVQDKI